MTDMKVEDYLTEEGKKSLELIKKKAAQNKRKKEIIDVAYANTQLLMKKFHLIEEEYIKEESILSPSARMMVFMRAINGLAHSHFKLHIDKISSKLDDEITEITDKELEKEIEDGSPGDDNSN